MQCEINRLVEDFERGRLSRRDLVARLTGLLAILAAGAATAQETSTSTQRNQQESPGTAGPTFKATGVDHIALSVTDVARSREFYEKHLGLRTTRDGDRSAFLYCGRDFLALFRAEKPGLDHYCFEIENYDPSIAMEKLTAAGLDPRRHGGRVYFDDPDGLTVQVAAG